MRIGKVHIVVLVLVLVAGVSLVSFTRSQAQSPLGGAAPTKVAVCKVVQIFAEYQRGKDLTKDLNAQGQAIQAENEKRTKKGDELKTQLEGYKVGSPKHEETLEAARRHEISRRVWLQMKQQEMLRKHKRLTEEMFKDIRATVAEVAKEKGYDLVMQSQLSELQDSQNVQQLVAQIDRQKVLYNTPAIDITATVLQRVNESYRVKK